MKEYIERETYYQQINDLSKGKHGDYCAAIQDCMTTLDEQPAADVAPVRHGKWEKRYYMHTADYTIKCLNCGSSYTLKSYESPHKFCPECGAIMDGGK